MIKKIKDLEDKILKAKKAYYNSDKPIMTDAVFDSLVDELKELDPENIVITSVGIEVNDSPWEKFVHPTPVGSLNKANSFSDLKKWYDKYCTTPFLSFKLDGLTLVLVYKDGKLTNAPSRGGGDIGEDLYKSAIKIPNIPKTIPMKGTVHIRGEVLFELDKFSSFEHTYSNPRNAASGAIRAFSGENCDKLTYFAYEISSDEEIETEVDQFNKLISMGFSVPEHHLLSSALEVQEFRDTLDRAKLNYLIDGLVIRENNLVKQKSFGVTDNRPKGAIAYKFDNQGAISTITSIDFQVGSSGIICPVAYFEPVVIEGASLKKCSLYNFARVKELGINVGSKVLIVRAGGIIPRLEQVVENIGEMIQPPTNCPACGSPAIEVGAFLKCSKPKDCIKSKKETVLKFIKAMNILEWGDKLIDNLFEKKMVNTIADLYKLTVDDLASLERMGTKSAQNCIDALNAQKSVSLERALGAIGIPGISESTFKLIVASGYDTFDKIVDCTEKELSSIKGLGEVKISTILNYFDNYYDDAALILSHLKIGVTSTTLVGFNFCFTGSFKSAKREVLEDTVKQHGGGVKDNVTKDTNFLVTNDPNSGSSKNTKAKQLGITILTEEGFLALVESKS